MSSSARLDTSHHGPPYPLKDAGVVPDSLTGIHNAGEVPLRCQQELHLGVLRGKIPEDSSQVGTEAMQYPPLPTHRPRQVLLRTPRTAQSTIMHVPRSCSYWR
jgi:hypothetical protein